MWPRRSSGRRVSGASQNLSDLRLRAALRSRGLANARQVRDPAQESLNCHELAAMVHLVLPCAEQHLKPALGFAARHPDCFSDDAFGNPLDKGAPAIALLPQERQDLGLGEPEILADRHRREEALEVEPLQ